MRSPVVQNQLRKKKKDESKKVQKRAPGKIKKTIKNY